MQRIIGAVMIGLFYGALVYLGGAPSWAGLMTALLSTQLAYENLKGGCGSHGRVANRQWAYGGDGMSTVKEHGMLFKAEMVRARQEGRKTQTRRNITFDNSTTGGIVKRKDWHLLRWAEAWRDNGLAAVGVDTHYWHVPFRDTVVRVYPRIRPGDVIWVRETWRPSVRGIENNPGYENGIEYRSDNAFIAKPDSTLKDDFTYRWRSSMLMPRWASRIDLDVISIRVERLQDISEEDARAEGVERVGHSRLSGCSLYAFDDNVDPKLHHTTSNNGTYDTARMAFAALWDPINAAKGFGWDVNHPVWIYEWPAK